MPKVERRSMTPDERKAYHAMRHTVTFPVASWDKRFFRHLGEMISLGSPDEMTITDKEAPQLWRLCVRYRRQWMRKGSVEDQELLRLAESLSAPDLRKVEAMRREQARIDEMKAKYAVAMQGTPCTIQ